jgi:hypothetical protein
MNICSWCCYWLDVYGLVMITNLDQQMDIAIITCTFFTLCKIIHCSLLCLDPVVQSLLTSSHQGLHRQIMDKLLYSSLVAQLLKSSHTRTTFVNQVLFFMVAFLFQRPSSIEGNGNCSITLHILSSLRTPF